MQQMQQSQREESMRLIESQNVHISPQSSSALYELQEEIEQVQYKSQEESFSSIKCLKKEKEYIIKELLKSLGFSHSLKTFEDECRTAFRQKNPEEASNKKKQLANKKKMMSQVCLKKMIENSPNYDTMIDSLERMFGDVEEMDSEDAAEMMEQLSFKGDFQRKMRSLYGEKREATIPKYKNIQILVQGKEAKFIDVNEEEEICLLDSEDYLHIITVRGETRPLKIQDSRETAYLKWINKNTIFLINNYAKITVLSFDGREIKIRSVLPLKISKLKRISMIVIRYPERPNREYVKILAKNDNNEFFASEVIVQNDIAKLTKGTVFESHFSFRSFNLLKIPKISSEDLIQDFATEKNVEHYYGLTENSRSIVKFDTTVKKEGVLWSSQRKIDSWANSKCRFYMVMLVVSGRERRETVEYEERKQTRLQHVFQYEFVKMNGHGSIMERVPLDFKSPLLPSKFSSNFTPISVSRVKLMDPQWLSCFDWEESIFYFSLATGKLLHIQDLESKDVQIIVVGPSNCIVYKSEDRIFLLSARQTERKKVVIEKRVQIRDRESLILRLTRNGIPETLLQLLQELRNNQIELIEA